MNIISYRLIQRLIYMAVAVLAVVALGSCTRDDMPGPDVVGPDETLVRLTIRTPGVSTPKPTTRAASTEYDIDNVKVIVLEKHSDGTYRYRYMADGQNVTQQEGQKTTFQALLKGTSSPVRLLLLANYGDALDNFIPTAGEAEDDIRSGITASYTWSAAPKIPMYGEVSLDRLNTETSNTISAVMLRGIARADISTELDMAVSNTFEITGAYVYRARASIQAIPDRTAMSESATPRVKAPSVPAGVGTLEKYYLETFDPMLLTGLYMPECETVSGEAAQLKGVTCIVVEGLYNGETTPTYYRIDFNSGEPGHPYGQILRNHRYQFVITRVTGRGWEDPDDAANNRATTIVTEIRMWEDFTTYMIANGDNYLGVESRDVVLTYKEGSQKTLLVQASVPYRISWSGSGQTTTVGGPAITNEYFSARIEDVPESDDGSKIIFTALSENNSGANRVSKLTLEWGGWVLEIKVTQLHEVANIEKSVRILSVFKDTTGNLGDNNYPANGAGMRRILSNAGNFSPRGKVDYFSGFDYSLAPSKSIFMNANGTNDESYRMRALVYAADVVYLGNDNRITEYGAKVVMEWLEASPHRVLIVGTDAPLTSYGLVRTDVNGPLSKDADWWYNQKHDDDWNVKSITGGGFRSVALNERNGDFMNGVFGRVADNFTMSVADGYIGYAKSYHEEIIPLLGFGNFPDYMSVGVHKEKRIVYISDASLFEASMASNVGGAVTTNHEKLWANIWAWIVHQVIWGE